MQGDIHLLPVVQFEAIPCPDLPLLPPEVSKDLLRDQKLLLQFLKVIGILLKTGII